jgi:hypothetical protein
MIIGKTAGLDVITIARKGLWGQFIPPRFLDFGYCYLNFLSSLIEIRRPPGSYSDRTFQLANRKSYLRLLLVFIVLICPIFSSFSFVIRVFYVDGWLAHRTTSWRRSAPYWWSPFRHPVIPLQSAVPLGSDAVYSRSSGDQTLLFPPPSLAARILSCTYEVIMVC